MSARDRIVLTLLPILAVLGAFWMLALSPARSDSAELTTKIDSAQTALDVATQQSAAAAAAQKRFGEDSAAVATLGKAVPAEQQLDALLYQLDVAAGDSKVKLESLAPVSASAPGAAPITLPPGITQVDLTLQFSGRFLDLEHFLRRIHDATSVHGDDVRVRGRLLSVQSVQLATEDDGGLSATVLASAYVATPVAPVDPSAPAAPAAPTTASAPPTQAAAIGVGG
ncbi:MAG: hypothetical protein ACJ762_20060 [Solirubrobacteraceae bacterium]